MSSYVCFVVFHSSSIFHVLPIKSSPDLLKSPSNVSNGGSQLSIMMEDDEFLRKWFFNSCNVFFDENCLFLMIFYEILGQSIVDIA